MNTASIRKIDTPPLSSSQRVVLNAGRVLDFWPPDKAHKHSFEYQRTINALLSAHDRAAHSDQEVTHTDLDG